MKKGHFTFKKWFQPIKLRKSAREVWEAHCYSYIRNETRNIQHFTCQMEVCSRNIHCYSWRNEHWLKLNMYEWKNNSKRIWYFKLHSLLKFSWVVPVSTCWKFLEIDLPDFTTWLFLKFNQLQAIALLFKMGLPMHSHLFFVKHLKIKWRMRLNLKSCLFFAQSKAISNHLEGIVQSNIPKYEEENYLTRIACQERTYLR